MSKGKMKNMVIFLMLGLFTASAFFIRLDIFNKTEDRTIDEMVYYTLGIQLSKDHTNYNSIPFGRELEKTGRQLPEYFSLPLFKHPPFFAMLIALFLKIFGIKMVAAGYVSLILAALMIPLIYLVGTLIADKKVGILAAALLWMDPISIMCSQKIWLGTTIAFFTLLSAFFFIKAVKEDRDLFFVLSGIAVGCAANTKYTGILITLAFLLFGLLYRRDLFSKGKFWLGLCMPFIMLVPWFGWNFAVYGKGIFSAQAAMHKYFVTVASFFLSKVHVVAIIFAVAAVAVYLIKKSSSKKESPATVSTQPENTVFGYVSLVFVVLFFFVFLKEQLANSFDLTYIPTHSWGMGFFLGEPPAFYFGRLIEYSIIYIFSIVALLIYQPDEDYLNAVIRLSAVVILLFFVAWGNYQSRYIVACLPFLMLLAAIKIIKIWDRIDVVEKFFPRLLMRASFSLLLTYIVMKTMLINAAFSFTNNMCYF